MRASWNHLLLLAAAALLEAAGDALVRAGLAGHTTAARVAWLGAGALVLFAYGLAVNLPGWDFGRLLGAYVAFFFVTAQVINALVFGQLPGLSILCGGALIVTGGLLIVVWQ